MIKVYIFNKSNSVLRVDIFEKFFQCINSEILLTRRTKINAVYQNVLNSQMRLASLTLRLILSLKKIRVRQSSMSSRPQCTTSVDVLTHAVDLHKTASR